MPTGSTRWCRPSSTGSTSSPSTSGGTGESDWAPDARYGTEHFASDLVGVMDAPGLGADGRGRALHGRPQLDGLLGLAPGPGAGALRGGQPPGPAGRAPPRHAPPGAPRAAAPRDARPGAQELQAAAGRDAGRARPPRAPGPRRASPSATGAFSTASTPGATAPGSRWMAGRSCRSIKAPTLLVRGELHRSCPRRWPSGWRRPSRTPRSSTMLGVYHHLVLDAPDAFSRILDDFLRGLPD